MPRSMPPPPRPPSAGAVLTAVLALALLPLGAVQAAKSKVTISQAAWFPKTQQLKVKAANRSTVAASELYDVNGRRLASGSGKRLNFAIGKGDLPTVPCAVRVQAGDEEAILPVKGAPKSCAKAPTCKITSPLQGAALKAGVDVPFQATAATKDRQAPLTEYDWDFAGGSMGEPIPGSNPPAFKRPNGTSTTVQFVRDNSTYRVRFSAIDAKGRRCEDTVNVVVGTPPSGLPAKVSEQEAPKLGSELDGVKGDLVVLPAPQWTMPHASDARTQPNLWASFTPLDITLNAYVYRKDLKPQLMGPESVRIQYSAASNPSDPVGSGSINSTSQNWPMGAKLSESSVRKSDYWEAYTGRDDARKTDTSTYQSVSWMAMAPWAWSFADSFLNKPQPDTGYFQDNKINFGYDYPPDEAAKEKKDPSKRALDPGSEMPGKANPYNANDPKPLVAALGTKLGANARMIPVTDVDDQNRVNPFPLMRVQAIEGGTVKAATDGVLTSGKDFKCRGCHAKGQIAANPNAPHTRDAFYSTAYAKWALARGSYKLPEKVLDKPEFFDAASNSLEDQEYAAALNYASLHQFYDAMTVLDDMLYGRNRDGDSGAPEKQTIGADSPMGCEGCHGSALAFFVRDEAWWQWDQHDWNSPAFDPDYSPTMHRFHGQLQYKSATDHSDIKRTSAGLYERYTGSGPNPLSLFPIFNPDGSQKPMEENCLQCHAGHREPLYRDRMYTAGVTCYDCHGDMLSVGQLYKKPANRVGADGNERRVPWFDEPDCGSCHTGNGSVGGNKANGYFSAGVMKRAFDESDRSGLSRKVDLNNTDAARFAVVPLYDLGVADPKSAIKIGYTGFDPATNELTSEERELKIKAPLFREGKDSHGNVPCAACHGAAHEIWPNRDPNANDNVAALQLQGHTGTIHECNVCHDKDAFRNEMDLDGGQYSGDPKPFILGGPHNMHPVDDPYWWKEAPGDTMDSTPNRNGKVIGGWHNNYAQKPGKSNEDQCAACHGADHQGTRLSRTPVDREFVNEKGRKVKVAAGTEIGCGLCHSVEKSFTCSPSRTAQAIPTATNTGSSMGSGGMGSGTSSSGGSGGQMGSGR